jgi:hypothetical protein
MEAEMENDKTDTLNEQNLADDNAGTSPDIDDTNTDEDDGNEDSGDDVSEATQTETGA